MLIKDLGFPIDNPMELYTDNKAAIEIAQKTVQHDGTKHVEVDSQRKAG